MSPRVPPAAADDCMEAAVDWQVRLTSGNASAADREALARWRQADARHEAAWQHVQGVLAEPVRQIHRIDQHHPGQLPAVHRSLDTAPSPAGRQRRRIVGGTALLLVAGAVGYASHRSQPLRDLLADVHTGTAETRHTVLPDGSGLELNARSAVDIRFTAERRLVTLRAGELLVQVARDPAADALARPFVVQSRHGTAQALGTRYLVREEADRSLVVVLEHSVMLQTGDGVQQLLREGEAAWMDGQRIERAAQRMAHRAAWAEGVLDVRDESLGEVVAALRPWRKGLLRISPAAARLRVFGVFRLGDTQGALQVLVDTQPITVTTYGPMLTLIDLDPAQRAARR
ncbi:FecR domain-containing protein [Paracidovorax wautersii]|uniref:Transmembrane sensor n=1 Tax=Paracidovorax wautersii TaxID=1177982 RepID=A0ABU1IFE4_9BURK|nr:FecR domain-containing protein [Paracidovorax wautersii]MDR6215907.1 transmembrane sensor [Paracidovorax wautersii]